MTKPPDFAQVFAWEMDFVFPPTLPTSGIPWERILHPLIPRAHAPREPHTWTEPEFLIPTKHAGSTQAVCNRDGFTVRVDVTHFSPQELMVKVKGDFVEVYGKHDQRKDGPGLVSRQFNRRYRIPEGVDRAALMSAVSPEGVLIITAPLLQGERSGLHEP